MNADGKAELIKIGDDYWTTTSICLRINRWGPTFWREKTLLKKVAFQELIKLCFPKIKNKKK